jgi:hypothetical protein
MSGSVTATCAPAPCCAPAGSATFCSASTCTTAAADRAGYCAKTGRVCALDLLDSIKAGKVRLEDVKTEDLPEEMQKLSTTERQEYLAGVEKERAKLKAEALDLDRQRSDFINQEMRKTNGQSGFDSQVMEMLREQAKKHHIAY